MKNLFKLTLLVALVLVAVQAIAQQKFITKTGHISFHSDAPLEKIEANNYQVASIITTTDGDISIAVLIKSFEFEKALMQEHFNENYMESEKYPKATFKGKILNIAQINLTKDGKYEAEVEGDLDMHGVIKKYKTKAEIEHKDGKLYVKVMIPVVLKDHNISIPKITKDKISETVQVKVDMIYEPYTK